MSSMGDLNNVNKKTRAIDRDNKNKEKRDKLKERLSRNILTSFVFAISEFEKEFGNIWGNNLDISNLSPDQVENREKWARTRKNIFDKGNAQRRFLEKEVDMYSVEYNGYQIKIVGKE